MHGWATRQRRATVDLPSAGWDVLADPLVVLGREAGRWRYRYANPAALRAGARMGAEISRAATGPVTSALVGDLGGAGGGGRESGELEVVDRERLRVFVVAFHRVAAGLVLTWRDVTAQRAAQEAVEARTERLRMLSAEVSDVLFVVAGDGSVQWVSLSVQRSLGWQAEDLVGQDFAALVHGEDRVLLSWASRPGGQPLPGRAEVRLAMSGGGWLPMGVEVRVTRPRGAAADIALVACRDISEQLAVRAELEASRFRLQLVADNAADLAYLAGPDQVVRWVAPTVRRSLGWEPEDLVGTRMAELVHPDDRSSTERLRGRIYAAELPEGIGELAIRMRTRDGEYKWMLGRATPVTDPHGNPDGIAVGMRDVQDLVVAVERAEAAAREARLDRLSIESAAIGLAICDLEGVITSANTVLCAMLGVAPEHLAGVRLRDLFPGSDATRAAAALAQLRGGGQDVVRRPQLHRWDGRTVWADIRVSLVSDEGEPHHLVAQFVDVTAEVQAAEELRASQERFQLLAENASDVVIAVGPGGEVTWISPAVERVLGMNPDALVGTLAEDLVGVSHTARWRTAVSAALTGREVRDILVGFRYEGGPDRPMAATGRPLRAGAHLVGAAFTLRDVRAEEQVRAELQRSEHQLRVTVDAAPQGIAVTDPGGLITRVNPALEALLGMPREKLVGQPLDHFLATPPTGTPGIVATATGGGAALAPGVTRVEQQLLSVRGPVWVEHSANLAGSGSDPQVPTVHLFSDSTQSRRTREVLAHRATHDALTGLPNRAALIEALEDRLAAMAAHPDGPEDTSVGVLYVDVDNLKPINDTHGHEAGDRVLESTAARLRACLRQHDLAARVGGDEFVILVQHVVPGSRLLGTAKKIISEAGQPVMFGPTPIDVTVSVGLATAEIGETADEVLAHADAALYRAKQAGRNQYHQ